MRKLRPETPCRFPARLAVIGVLLATTAIGVPRAESLVAHRLRSAIATRLLQQFGRPVLFEGLQLSASGLVVHNVRLPRVGNETDDPLVIRHVRIEQNWWELIRVRNIRFRTVVLDGVQVRAGYPTAESSIVPRFRGWTWTAWVTPWSRLGVERVTLRNVYLSIASATGIVAVAENVAGEVRLGHETFEYLLTAKSVRWGSTEVENVRLRGEGDGKHVTVREGNADGLGGRLRVQGTAERELYAATMTLHANDLPLDRVLSQFVPKKGWTATGRLSGEATVTVRRGDVASVAGVVHLRDGRLSYGDREVTYTAVRSRIDWSPERTIVSEFVMENPDHGVWLSGEGEVAHTEGRPGPASGFRLSVRLQADGRLLQSLAEVVGLHRVAGRRWQARRGSLMLGMKGTLGDVQNASASGRVLLEGLRVQVNSETTPWAIARMEAAFEHSGSRTMLRDVTVDARGWSLAGELVLSGGSVRSRGRLVVNDLRSLQRLTPGADVWRAVRGTSKSSGGSVQFRMSGSLQQRGDLQGEGQFEVHDIAVAIHGVRPDGVPIVVPVTIGAGKFRYRRNGTQEEWTVSEAWMRGPSGQASASGQVQGSRFQIAIRGRDVDTELLRWIVPGTVEGGRVAGTLNVQGEGNKVRHAYGHFDATMGWYRLPVELGLSTQRISVSYFGGDYHWTPERATVRNAVLRSELVNAEGTIAVVRKGARIRAELNSAQLGKVLDLWPACAGWLHGGQARAMLDINFGVSGTGGTLLLRSAGGALSLPSREMAFATVPVDRARLTLQFAPGVRTVTGLAVHGPTMDLEGDFSWKDDGKVFGQGRVTLSRAFTDRLIPKGWHWLARLFGVRRLGSPFAIEGTTDRMVVHAGITRRWFWKFARAVVPRTVREMVSGRVPLRLRGGTNSERNARRGR